MRGYDRREITEAYRSQMDVEATMTTVDPSLSEYELLSLGCEAFIGALNRPEGPSLPLPYFRR